MCEPASFVVTKKQVFWSKNTESHHEIISEFNLKENDVRGNYSLICVEIVPPNNDYTLSFSKWVYKLDVGGYDRETPEWYDAKDVEKRCRLYLEEWRKAKVVMPKEKRDCINIGQTVAIYGTVNNIGGSATVNNISGSATVNNISGSATVNNISGSATVNNIYGSATVKYIGGSATVKYIGGSATVKYIGGSATVNNISGSATVNNISDSATVNNISDSATVKNIYGSATVNNIGGSATVNNIYGSATVNNIYGSATVKTAKGKCVIVSYNSLSPDILKSSQAVIIERSGNTVQCFIGKDC